MFLSREIYAPMKSPLEMQNQYLHEPRRQKVKRVIRDFGYFRSATFPNSAFDVSPGKRGMSNEYASECLREWAL